MGSVLKESVRGKTQKGGLRGESYDERERGKKYEGVGTREKLRRNRYEKLGRR